MIARRTGARATAALHEVTDDVCVDRRERRRPSRWHIALGVRRLSWRSLGFDAGLPGVTTGIGVWGNNQPVGWAWDITNFVCWIGIGHAGTLISAMLFLFRQNWRTSINRFAEAMTIFAVGCAGDLPAAPHRPSVVRCVLAVPASRTDMQLWPKFRSPLMWDVFAVSTYVTVSLLFWYMGLVPDLATLRDRATSQASRQMIYGILRSAGAARRATGTTTRGRT